jgi:hypothetical protein
MIERDVFGLASAVSADSIPGVNDLAPETASSDQHGSLDSVGCHLGELLQPDASADTDGSLQHGDDLVAAAWWHGQGNLTQNLPGSLFIPGPYRGTKGHRCVAFPQLARVA